MYSSKTSLSLSATEKMDRKAASAASFTGMMGLRTLAKMAGARVERLEDMRVLSVRLTVRMTTKASRLVSIGLSGVSTDTIVSIMFFKDSGLGLFFGTRRYFPAASTQLSDMKVCIFVRDGHPGVEVSSRSYYVSPDG